ncbi:universal stress protein [Prolixibacteraceae bacterium Z1-6]|uniref:Universal stress protein n=1 Tax=Draconibacterium aestuarii TaxID=2998507 RepID=A0A9X3J554_9BACT|nr:universal stress protein [Prolixibacteraceae bacterium Z1-6]
MKYRSNSILAHIPQNRNGELILKQALFFQKKLGMRIFLMDIIKSGSFFPFNPNSKRNKIRHQNELNKFTEFVKKHLQSEIPNNIMLRIGWGKVIKTLITESEEGGHEFVLLDKSEKQNAEDLSRADVDRYISKSFCPVLTINKDYQAKEIKRIFIPIDISQRTKKRLYWATFFAKKLDAKIQIVSALNADIKETTSLAYKKAESLKEMLQKRGVDCGVKIIKVHGQERHHAILEYLEKEKPDMVIIRTHRESRFTGKKIGTFVSEIVHCCKMPVFTVGGVSQDFNPDTI